MNESAEALAGNAGMDDALNIKNQLRRMKPSWSDIIANLLLACAGMGFPLLVVSNFTERRNLPVFAVGLLVMGFGWFVRFLDNLIWRSRINRLLRY